MTLKKFFLATAFSYSFAAPAQQCMPDINFWGDFKGRLGEREIALSVYKVNAELLMGNYRYIDDEKNVFALTGSPKDCTYYLEAVSDTKAAGKFVLSYTYDKVKKEDNYKGNFTTTDNKKSIVTLQLNSMVGGTLTQRYGELFGTTQEVDSFAAKIKTALINNDKNWLIEHCRYPLSVYVGRKAVTIKDKQVFVLNYNKFFTSAYINKIKKINCYNMFSNQDGAGMGNGQIWINQTLTSTTDNYKYCIRTINL